MTPMSWPMTSGDFQDKIYHREHRGHRGIGVGLLVFLCVLCVLCGGFFFGSFPRSLFYGKINAHLR